jgi:hypothetical protein
MSKDAIRITQADIDTANANADFYEAAAMRAQARGDFERAVEFKRDAEQNRKFARRYG